MPTRIEAPPAPGSQPAPATRSALRPLLTEEMLLRFQERAPRYDSENRFFTEDFEELRDSG